MSNAENDRSTLGFVAAVVGKFDFLGSAYGVMVASSDPTIVRWTGNGLFVNIWHGRQSYELGLDIATSGVTASSALFHMVDLIAAVDGPEVAAGYRTFAATTKESVEHGLTQLSQDLQRCGSAALRGDPSTFGKMAKLREARTRRFAEQVNSRQVRAKADEAWHQKNLGEVAALLGSIEPFLSAAERGRLDYARTHQ